MIISRTPLRITLAGGGTDLPGFYTKFGGSVLSMAINKYIYVTCNTILLNDILKLRYLQTEETKNVNNIKNERARVALQHFGVKNSCEITSMADLSANSGLGSSGSYLVGLINCLQIFTKKNLSIAEIAELACHLEMTELKEPVGKQDQYIASYGGIKTLDIQKDGSVSVSDFDFIDEDLNKFIVNNRIYSIDIKRNASDILRSQTVDIINFEEKMKSIREIGFKIIDALKMKKYDYYGSLLNEHWTQKKELSSLVTITKIDKVYEQLLKEKKILGGKIIGAGGGGFLLLYANKNHDELDMFMKSKNFFNVNYNIDSDGTKIIYNNEK